MKTPVTKELLFAYFAGHATAFQKQLIDEWAKEAEHREIFYDHLADWERQQPQYVVDTSAALERHRVRMTQSTAPATAPESAPTVRPLLGRRGWLGWLMAASVAGLLVSGWFLQDRVLYQTYDTTYGQTRSLTLPDGSRVELNANSTLRLPRFGFGTDTRRVRLRGEAAFSVVHTPDDQRFVVETDGPFHVEVLGTEFSVYNRRSGGRVVLNRGKVQLHYRDGADSRRLLMKPGDQVEVNPRGQAQLRQLRQPENTLAWRDHRYVFDQTTLADVVRLFEDNYGLHLRLADSTLADWTVSGSFTAHSADELLETLMQASSLTYVRTGNRIVITDPASGN